MSDENALELHEPIREGLSSTLGGSGWALDQLYAKTMQHGISRVFRAHQVTRGRTVAVKANPLGEQNVRQFRAMVRMTEVTLDCVKPLFLDVDHRYFAMEWHDAPLLVDGMEGSDRLRLVERAGAWLRSLHTETSAGDGVDPMLAAQRLMPPATCPGHRRVRVRLRERRTELGNLTAPLAMLHTDFQLHNLFDTGDRLLAFDRVDDRIGATYFDVARFLIGCGVYRARAARAGGPWPDSDTMDRRAFFRGYGPIDHARLGIYDVVEDLVLARLWLIFASRIEVSDDFRERAELLDGMMRERGLLGESAPARPLRCVSSESGVVDVF